MPVDDPTAARVGCALVAALASIALMTLGLALVVPVAVVLPGEDASVTETVGTLWQEGIDHGFTDGGGADALVPAFLVLVVVLAAVAALYLCTLLLGGSLGSRGALTLRVASVVLLLGAAWLALRGTWVAGLAADWNERGEPVERGPGGWVLMAGAIVVAALALPRPVRELWTAGPRRHAHTAGTHDQG